jgi:hypothetical protein
MAREEEVNMAKFALMQFGVDRAGRGLLESEEALNMRIGHFQTGGG